MLTDYLRSVFNNPAEAGHITTINTDTNNKIISTPATFSEQKLLNLEITTEEDLKALNDMKNKSPGPDNIYPRVLQETKS